MHRLAIFLVVITALFFPLIADAEGSHSARDIAQRSFDIAAGDAWNDARYFEFTFNVDREGKTVASHAHRWDRFTGDYRVEGKSREGKSYVVSFNVQTKNGQAWLDGEEQSEPAELLDYGYARFINDTYWLLVPVKMLDPGVTLEAAGSRSDECGRTFDGVKLTFDSVGLTPGDQYWLWVDSDTGLVDLWQMQLEGMTTDDPKREYRFREYERIGGLLLSLSKPSLDGSFRIWFSGVEVRPDVPEGAFEK